MNAPAVQAQVRAEIGTGGGVPKLALHRVANLRVLCPDTRLQQQVVVRSQAFEGVRKRETKQLRKLKQLRSGLAADLLSGRVRTVSV